MSNIKKCLYLEKRIVRINPSRNVSVGCPTQNVKKQPSQCTLRVQTPIGYHLKISSMRNFQKYENVKNTYPTLFKTMPIL